jgi:hypothetical protein
MQPRLMNAPTKPKIQAPQTQNDWRKLMQVVITRASEVQHRLLPGLLDAQVKGQTESFLRKLGIIHQNDIERLFPKT